MNNPHLCQSCQKEPAQERHECPFQAEINGEESADYCNCCDDCRQNCLMDI